MYNLNLITFGVPANYSGKSVTIENLVDLFVRDLSEERSNDTQGSSIVSEIGCLRMSVLIYLDSCSTQQG